MAKSSGIGNFPNNFTYLLSKIIKRLIQQGHSIEKLTPLLQKAAQNLVLRHQQANDATDNKTLYIHWVYDPKDINNKELRDLYSTILQNFDKMIIALSRPKNLCNMLTRSRLSLPESMTKGHN